MPANIRKVADSIFKTGPKDSVAAIDIYKDTPAAKPPVPVTKQASDVVQAAGFEVRKAFSLQAFTDAAAKGNIDSFITKDGAMTRLKEISGGLQSPINDLKADLQMQLLGGIGLGKIPLNKQGLPGAANILILDKIKNKDQLIAVYNNVTSIVDKSDVSSADGVMKMLNAVSGNSELGKILDKQAEFAVLGNILKTVSKFHLPELIDKMLDKIENAKDQKRFLLDNLMSLVLNSDIPALEKTLVKCGGNSMLDRVPDIVNLILMSYRFPLNTSPVTYGTCLTQLLNLLNGIQDDWDKYDRNGVLIDNLEPFSYASPDAKTLLTLNVGYRDIATFAPEWPSCDIRTKARELYPYAAIQP